MSPLTEPTRIVLRNGWQPMDPDAATYITAVETADGQALEEPVKIAIDNFVLGCKADGIWDAIKASCILAGARTLNGALVPLAGTAPTNYNFVAGDYDRKTGLVGDGSTKYLDSNRDNNADLQDDKHISMFATTVGSGDPDALIAENSTSGSSQLFTRSLDFNFRLNSASASSALGIVSPGFIGVSRNNASTVSYRINNQPASAANQSAVPTGGRLYVLNRSAGSLYGTARLAFYSIGESLDLAKLDARVTDLINKFAEVIP